MLRGYVLKREKLRMYLEIGKAAGVSNETSCRCNLCFDVSMHEMHRNMEIQLILYSCFLYNLIKLGLLPNESRNLNVVTEKLCRAENFTV